MRLLNNTVHLSGCLTDTPDSKMLSDGSQLIKMRLRVFNHEQQTTGESSIFQLLAWDDLGNDMARRFKKGSCITVRGKLQNRFIERGGIQVVQTEIHVLEFLALAKTDGKRNRK